MRVDSIPGLKERLQCIPRILAVQNRRMGLPMGRDDLADVTQESLVVIWRKIGEFDPTTCFESWAYRICFLELMNHVRKKQRRQRLLGDLARHTAAESMENRASTPALNPHERVERVHLALDLLAEEEAHVVRLYHFEEQTFQEVGVQLRIPTGTAKTRYYRGITKMREYLRNHDREDHLERSAYS